jgi:DeoR family deoxyribose operon repressor
VATSPNKIQRRKTIIQLLQQQDEVSVSEIADLLKVSEITVRRDLSHLENERMIRRTHGGAMLCSSILSSISDTETYTFEEQTKKNIRKKSIIGMKAASLIEPNETILLDSGTTTPFIAKYINNNIPITVLCYTSTNAFELIHRPNINLILAGGYYDRRSHVFRGNECSQLIHSIRADKAFVSAAGVDEKLGLTTYFYFESEIKKTFIKLAKRIILVADSTKFGKISISYFASLDQVNTIITDDGLSPEYRDIIENSGIELIVV